MRQVKIKELAAFIGRGITPEYVEEDGLMVINQKCVRGNKVLTAQARFTSSRKKYASEKLIRKNDILINSTGTGTLGRVGFVKTDFQCLCDTHVTILRLRSEVNPLYVSYYLHLNKAILESLGIGSTNQIELSAKDIGNINIALPDRPIQDKVVEILSCYDDLIDLNNKRMELLESISQDVFKEWFVRYRFPGYEECEFAEGKPAGWEIKRVKDIIDFDPTTKVSRDEEIINVPMAALSTNSMVLDEDEFEVVESVSGSKFKNGDTLFARITPCLENGKTGFVSALQNQTATGSTEFIVLRAKSVTPEFVYLFARSDYFRETAIASMNGADGRQRAKSEKLQSLKYSVPPKTIIDEFTKIVRPNFEQIEMLQKKNKMLIRQRDILLPRLLSGQLLIYLG